MQEGAWVSLSACNGLPSAAQLADAIRDAAAQHHGSVGQEWLKKVVADSAHLRQLIGRGIRDFVTEVVPVGASGQIERVARRFGLVAVAGELATHYGLTGWQREKLIGQQRNASPRGWKASAASVTVKSARCSLRFVPSSTNMGRAVSSTSRTILTLASSIELASGARPTAAHASTSSFQKRSGLIAANGRIEHGEACTSSTPISRAGASARRVASTSRSHFEGFLEEQGFRVDRAYKLCYGLCLRDDVLFSIRGDVREEGPALSIPSSNAQGLDLSARSKPPSSTAQQYQLATDWARRRG